MNKWNLLAVAAFVFLKIAGLCNGAVTSSYIRGEMPSIDMPLDAFPPPSRPNSPEQVHITQGDYVGRSVIISWVTPLEPGRNTVTYGTLDGRYINLVQCAAVTRYTFYNYTSGFIHHCTIRHLQHDTQYFYVIGDENAARAFTFTTPPALGPDVPYTFGLIGDLGQTFDSNQTLENYVANSKSGAVLFVGDLSYADHYPYHDQRRWDTWGRFVEKSTAYQPWIWTAGNHELDFVPEIGENKPFKPYLNRFHVPYRASESTSPLWYAIKRASTHIIVLSSYSAYGKYTPQYEWLKKEFSKVKRDETPWLIVLVHTPLYNSYNYHYMEGESMRAMIEHWLVQNKVDIVISGHVHGYERTERISNIAYNITNGRCDPILDPSAPVYVTIGDGGNIEGRANNFTHPQPSYSAFREASFGYATFEIKNRTHAHFTWYRNNEGGKGSSIGDSVWIHNRHFQFYI